VPADPDRPGPPGAASGDSVVVPADPDRPGPPGAAPGLPTGG
jgi:hypothetical protein